MVKSSITISQVKESVRALSQKQVIVTLNLGRNRFVSFKGKVSGVYPALFTVVPNDKTFKGKTSYSYSEYLCGKVKLDCPKESKVKLDCPKASNVKPDYSSSSQA